MLDHVRFDSWCRLGLALAVAASSVSCAGSSPAETREGESCIDVIEPAPAGLDLPRSGFKLDLDRSLVVDLGSESAVTAFSSDFRDAVVSDRALADLWLPYRVLSLGQFLVLTYPSAEDRDERPCVALGVVTRLASPTGVYVLSP